MRRSTVLDSLDLPVTQEECARLLGITRRQAEIIEKRAISKLQVALRLSGMTIDDFREALAAERLR